jgi:hypothetical protein
MAYRVTDWSDGRAIQKWQRVFTCDNAKCPFLPALAREV